MGDPTPPNTLEAKSAMGAPIKEGIALLKTELGDAVEKYCPTPVAEKITSIQRDEFISAPGFNARLDEADGSITRAYLTDGEQLIVISNKVGFAPFGGVDMRHSQRYIYLYDGKGTIKAIEPDGKESTFTGPYGDPDGLVKHFGQENILGRPMESTSFVRAAAPQPQTA
jgi:hypothetical protein